MEYVEGVDLLTHLLPGQKTVRDLPTEPMGSTEPVVPHASPVPGCPDMAAVREVFGQLSLGIHGLHEAGLLHRDLKPANVLVGNGRVVLLDFGMVAPRWTPPARVTLDDRCFGTPAYMAPEQAAGDAASTASDWYAFGVMLYEVLCGRLPFDGSMLDILVGKQRGLPTPASALACVPPELDRLCTGLLSPQPERRPAGRHILATLGLQRPEPTLRTRGGPPVPRDAELRALRAAYEQASGGQPTCVCLGGASATGKSALGRRFARMLLDREDACVLDARCFEHEALPLKGLDGLVDALGRYLKGQPEQVVAGLAGDGAAHLGTVFPVLRKLPPIERARRGTHAPLLPPGPARSAACAALLSLLLRLSEAGPLVLWLDDAHACDAPSAEFLARLLDAAGGRPVLLLYAARSGCPDPVTASLQVLSPGAARSRLTLPTGREPRWEPHLPSALDRKPVGATLGAWEKSPGLFPKP